MKIETYDGRAERKILTACITSTPALAALLPLLQDGMPFASKEANLAASLCVQYFEKHSAHPGAAIEDLFAAWAEKRPDKETTQLVEKLLSSLSGDYEAGGELNVEHIVDMAKDHFEKVKVKRLTEATSLDLEQGDLSKAKERILSFAPLDAADEEPLDVLQDLNAIRAATTYAFEDPLVVYPEGCGEFFGDALRRGQFVAFTGIDKSGKSFWLTDMAFRAIGQRRRTLYIEAGDLTRDQVMGRFLARAAKRPLHAQSFQYPTDMIAGTPPTVTSELRTYTEPLGFRAGVKAFQEVAEKRIRSKESYFKLLAVPNTTMTIEALKAQITSLQRRHGWVVDLVLIDYADILAAPSKCKDEREGINHIWTGLRRLAQQCNCLVVTATQAKATAYGAKLLTREHFSGDKRKLATVSGMVGINAQSHEAEQGLTRLNWIVRRDRAYNEGRCCYCAGAKAIANPCIRSSY